MIQIFEEMMKNTIKTRGKFNLFVNNFISKFSIYSNEDYLADLNRKKYYLINLKNQTEEQIILLNRIKANKERSNYEYKNRLINSNEYKLKSQMKQQRKKYKQERNTKDNLIAEYIEEKEKDIFERIDNDILSKRFQGLNKEEIKKERDKLTFKYNEEFDSLPDSNKKVEKAIQENKLHFNQMNQINVLIKQHSSNILPKEYSKEITPNASKYKGIQHLYYKKIRRKKLGI
jgi:hypothetical protein